MNILSKADSTTFPMPEHNREYPIVGIIDSGICPNNTLLSPWIIARETYVPLERKIINMVRWLLD
jgi:hypothetical protein